MDQYTGFVATTLALVIILAPIVGLTVLGPVNRAAGRLQAPTRFQLSDFFWLIVQFQFVLWYCTTFVGIGQRFFFPLMLGFLSFAAVAMWAGAVSFLCRAGVKSALRRAVFILVLLPMTLALMVAAPLTPIVSFMIYVDPAYVRDTFRLRFELFPSMAFGLLGGALIAIPALSLGMLRISRWMVEDSGLAPAPAPRSPPTPDAAVRTTPVRKQA